jgi:hypothetical protein
MPELFCLILMAVGMFCGILAKIIVAKKQIMHARDIAKRIYVAKFKKTEHKTFSLRSVSLRPKLFISHQAN